MTTEFSNIYNDHTRASAYDTLTFPGTYALAYRDIPTIIGEHIHGRKALDFGCGTGRSTRYLHELGFDALGVDISEPMLARARERDPKGTYTLLPDGDLSTLKAAHYDLILSSFTFDNIPTTEKKTAILSQLKRLLTQNGRIINLVSTPDIYLHEWISFSTKDFPENKTARSGDIVKIIMLDVEDQRPVEDILCTDNDYREAYQQAKLTPIATYRPLAKPDQPSTWISETTIAPWVIYVLAHTEHLLP